MRIFFKITKTKLLAFASFLTYTASIAIGSIHYLPFQTYAPGIFSSYSIDALDFFGFILIALTGAALLPKNITRPSDWFVIIFIIFLLVPGLTLGVTSDDTSFEDKIIIMPTLIACIAMVSGIKNIRIADVRIKEGGAIRKALLYFSALAWLILFAALVTNYHGVMRLSGPEEIYAQRELTSAARGLWGYAQLYFTFLCSTLLIAYGFSSGKWAWVAAGSLGYFIMYLITAERSQLLFPIFFAAVNYLCKTDKNPQKLISATMMFFAAVILGAAFLREYMNIFDLSGFYLFSRLIATPAQFILDYYEFFSTNGYTYFSQVRGFDFFIDAPNFYASNPKWPQLGWIVGAEVHGIESNSNASFLATDGAASLGAFGMVLVTFALCIYLIIMNNLSPKFPKPFWSIIFAQQAFVLTNGSLFSLFLSFGGVLYLLLFILYKPKLKAGAWA